MLKTLITIPLVILFSSASFAETTSEVFLPGQKKPTADQPVKNGEEAQTLITVASDENRNEDGKEKPSIPPWKGVIHLPMVGGEQLYTLEGLSIDPETEERPVKIPTGMPGIGYIQIDSAGLPVVFANIQGNSYSNPQTVTLPILAINNQGMMTSPLIVLQIATDSSNAVYDVQQTLGISRSEAEQLLNQKGSVVAMTDSSQAIVLPGLNIANIDPERERPIDFPSPLPGLKLINLSTTDIDPEREYPILGGKQGIGFMVTVPGTYPDRDDLDKPLAITVPGLHPARDDFDKPLNVTVPGVYPARDDFDRPLARHPLETTKPGYPYPVINIPPAKRSMLDKYNEPLLPPGQVDIPKMVNGAETGSTHGNVSQSVVDKYSEQFPPPGQVDVPKMVNGAETGSAQENVSRSVVEKYTEQYPPPGQVDVPKMVIQDLRDMARNLSDPNLELYTLALTTAIVSSSAIMAYQLLGLGKGKALAAVIPPGAVNSFFGRTGYRVPSHDVYDTDDVTALSNEIKSMNDQELVEFLKSVDSELLDYLQTVDDYVRRGRGIEFQQWCENAEQCS